MLLGLPYESGVLGPTSSIGDQGHDPLDVCPAHRFRPNASDFIDVHPIRTLPSRSQSALRRLERTRQDKDFINANEFFRRELGKISALIGSMKSADRAGCLVPVSTHSSGS